MKRSTHQAASKTKRLHGPAFVLPCGGTCTRRHVRCIRRHKHIPVLRCLPRELKCFAIHRVRVFVYVFRVVYGRLAPLSSDVAVFIRFCSAELVEQVRVPCRYLGRFCRTVLRHQHRQTNDRQLRHLDQRRFRRRQHVEEHRLVANGSKLVPVELPRYLRRHFCGSPESDLVYKRG